MNNLHAGPYPVVFYDYWQVVNGYSPQVAGTGGLNLTEPHTTHTAFYNPALLAFRERTVISGSIRYFKEDETLYAADQLPDRESSKWYRKNFSYLGIDSENVGFSYFSLANLHLEREYPAGESTERYYLDYYLDAYRLSFAEKSGLLAFGLNLSLLKGRVVYLRESMQEEDYLTEQFIDSPGWGYNLDFGAVVKSDRMSYGLTIPNLLGKIYWKDNPDYTLQRRLHLAAQWGAGENYITGGLTRKFDFKSDNTYHLGFQQAISFGVFRGEYQFLPLRVGLFFEQFKNWQDVGYSIGSGYQYSIFQIDISYMMLNQEKKNHSLVAAISVGL